MISATSNWIAANANLKKKPIFLVEIEGYNRAFSSAPSVGHFSGLPVNSMVQHAEKIVDFGGLSFVPSTATLPNATPAGNLIFAFLYATTGGGAVAITDDAGNTWIPLVAAPGGNSIYVWYCVANAWAAGNNITWDPGDFYSHHNAEFFIVEVPAAYSGFTSGSNSGTGTAATCTVGSNVVLYPAGPTNWYIFMVALAQETTAAMGINLIFMITGSASSGDDVIATAAASAVLCTSRTVGTDWIVGIDDLSLTVSDLDGGADLSDLVFTVQDRAQAITGDMASFTFEGKQCRLLQGFGVFDSLRKQVVFDPSFTISDYLTLFAGRVNSVASTNDNQEYVFTVPDIRQDLTKVIYQTGDDGFPTDSNHRKTISANPIDILIDVLENQVGYSASQIDVAGLMSYRDQILAGYKFVFSLDSPPAAKDFIENEILKPLGGYHWTDNLGVIRVRFAYPIAPASVATLDHTNLLNVPLAEQAALLNQMTFRFDADTGGKFQAESVQNWNASIAKFGLFGEHVVESTGMRSAFQGYFMAQFVARLFFLRYGNKQLQIEGLGAAWSQCRIAPGDIISVTSSLVPDRAAGTMGITSKTFEVFDRTWSPLAGIVKFKVLEIDLSKFRQYLIAPNAEADFTAASGADQGTYLFQCDVNDLYSDSTPGNTLC